MRLIDADELLTAVDTWDKFGCDEHTKLVPVKDCYVPYVHYDDVVKAIKGAPTVQVAEKYEQFAEWVAKEIFDENLEMSFDAFAELACRKLEKLGIVKANGNMWELIKGA